ncbi:acyl-CoA thioesterase [Parahaliea aestuarii]|uniref:Acyl-CoA thioesterase 2 n=1 Tax=Parahaliea aestuarii TaxID=1852021 RepID=A0A5C8ZPG2_9GAMM|nr:acyl-CoA thioesterase II [Parahaliea aestuarii]TXS90115.1 acyl-CoA thioesterase II [Parahaliea aestuarii]
MTELLDKLISQLEIERIDRFLFLGRSPKFPPRVFGGQVLAQALYAASQTVDSERLVHSMHGYFLRPGDPSRQLVYEVDPIRDGGSFTTRRVVAKQNGVAIFNTALSFQAEEDGLEHQSTAPEVIAPEELETDAEYWTRMAEERPGLVHDGMMMQPIERRPVLRRDFDNPEPTEPIQHYWFRVPADIGDNPVRHRMLLAYMSDFALLGTAMLPHPYSGRTPGMQVASLDHAIWFHRQARVDDFLLYTMDSPAAGGGRGFSRGSFYTRDGVLIASTAQESLQRVPRSKD